MYENSEPSTCSSSYQEVSLTSEVVKSHTGQNCDYAFETMIGLNVGMSGDASDSNEGDDNFDTYKLYGLVGLQNVGNTCYMNAALQALSNTLPLTNFFLECFSSINLLSEGRNSNISHAYQALMREMWLGRRGTVNPTAVLSGIRSVQMTFRGCLQHDTQEFLRNFMDHLHEELKQVCQYDCYNDVDYTVDESPLNSSFESSDAEYETCDSGVSDNSSLSDETEQTSRFKSSRTSNKNNEKRKKSVIDSQPGSGSMKAPKKKVHYRSIISDIFDGKLLSSVQCLTCYRVSSRVETFQDLSLPIPSRDHVTVLQQSPVRLINDNSSKCNGTTTASLITSSTSTNNATCSQAILPEQNGWVTWILHWLKSWFYGPVVSLYDCLAALFSIDELKGDNMYYCERCHKLRNGIKFSKMIQLPEVLCIHLKRFRHEIMYSSKISSFVSFPLKGLDVSPYLHDRCVSEVRTYELFAVICHHGTAGGGHYTCYALNDDQWYEFDDQFVTRVSAETVQASEAYVLFYRKNACETQDIKIKANKLAAMSDDLVEDMVYVSKQWLNRFKYCAEPGPIDNSDFLCRHGLINPERALILHQLAIPLPKQVYDYLENKFGGCPPIKYTYVCKSCQLMQKRINLEMEGFLKLNYDFINLRLESTHLLSALWFDHWQNFVRKFSPDPPGPIDNTECQNAPNNYIEVNKELWMFFHNIYGGGPEMPLLSEKMIQHNDEGDSKPEINSSSEFPDTSTVEANSDKSNSQYNHVNNYLHLESSNDNGVEVHDQSINCDTLSDNCVDILHQNNGLPNNCNNNFNSSSASSASVTDDEATNHIDLNNCIDNKFASKMAKEKLYYKTKRRRFRCKINYKSKLQNTSSKNLKRKDVC